MGLVAAGRGALALLALLPAAALADAPGRWTFAPAASGGGRLAYHRGAGDPHEHLRLECAQPGGTVTLHAETSPIGTGRAVRLRFENAGRVATVRGTLHRGPAGTGFASSLHRDDRLLVLLHGSGTLLVRSDPRGFSDAYDLATAAEPLRRFDASCHAGSAGRAGQTTGAGGTAQGGEGQATGAGSAVEAPP